MHPTPHHPSLTNNQSSYATSPSHFSLHSLTFCWRHTPHPSLTHFFFLLFIYLFIFKTIPLCFRTQYKFVIYSEMYISPFRNVYQPIKAQNVYSEMYISPFRNCIIQRLLLRSKSSFQSQIKKKKINIEQNKVSFVTINGPTFQIFNAQRLYFVR